jgi:autotransporter translocation and assembly factor TamB
VTLDRHGLRAQHGSVTVGSTRTRFSALASGADYALRLNAPQADLSDFNDLFDAGDTLGGRGRVDAGFMKRASTTRTDADIAIAALRFRRFDLGDARAAWRSSGGRVTGSVDFGGASGRLDASGVLVLPAHAPLAALLARSRFDGRAQVAGLDLGVWLPALGYQVPVAGRLDATASIAGLLRNPAVTTDATLRGGSIGAFPVDRFELTASSTLERTTIRRLELDLPSISIAGSGQFGLASQSKVALTLHAQSPNLADLSARLAGGRFPVTGTARADVAIDGTRAAPRVAGTVSVANATVRGVALPQARAGFVLRGRDIELSDAAIDFAAGSLALEGSVPLQVAPLALGPASARVALTLAARDLALADFSPLLPAGSILRGTLGGAVTVGGTVGTPRLGGRLTLAGGSLQTPLEAIPLTSIAAAASFDGAAARLDLLHASAGGGTLDAGGSIRFADLVHPGSDATYAFVARAKALHLDLPAYGSGIVDGTLSFERVANGIPSLAGDMRLSDGTIPFSALLSAGGATAGGFDTAVAARPAPARAIAFDLDVSAVRNVRVRSANVDIGGRGDLHVGGTLAAPELLGGFTSTGGTITYFNTVFRLIDGTVTFAPELGVVPTLDARGVTHVINPDPNTVRNLAGTADVTLSLLGPVTNLTIGLSSDPSYDRQQILGLLLNAPALGASNLFGETRDQATLYGSNATASLPPGVATFRSTTGELSVAQEAFGVANAQFTRTLLAPIESTFASAVGLSNFNVNVDYTGNVGVSARKVLGKSVNAVYGSSFGYPYRQTFGFEIKPSPVTAAQVTVFDTLGQTGLNGLTPTSITNSGKIGIAQPYGGTTGFALSFQRLF